jgi:hypothetical protein
MNKTHASWMTVRLEEVVDRGVAHILWGELYRWYDTPRITINVWRDIVERWEEVADDENRKDNEKLGELRYIEGGGGIHLIAKNTAKRRVD